MQAQDTMFARLREHNNASGGYLLNLIDAAYAPRDHPDRRNLWSKALVEQLINEAEAQMERVRPLPLADQSLADFNMEYNFYRQWTAHVRDTVGVLRRLLADDPPTVASHGAIPNDVMDSDAQSRICCVSTPAPNPYSVHCV